MQPTNHFNYMRKYSFIFAAVLALAACCQVQPQAFSVIPMPAEVAVSEGAYPVAGKAFFLDPRLDNASQDAIWRFKDALEAATGRACPLGKGEIQFLLNPELASEQYTVQVSKDGVVVEASALNGFVYACETLKQMLPAAIYGGKKAKAHWVLPYVSIQDQPRFAYRGMHLDVSRHFWSVDEVKRYLDVMTVYKLNRLHWHLTDDQGWRAEIKAYPKLMEVSAWRNGTVIKKDWGSNDGIRYGGFYTQEEMKEVVAYAAARGITVIPEVDLPGHMVAALAAYPELGCTGGPYEVWTRWGVAKECVHGADGHLPLRVHPHWRRRVFRRRCRAESSGPLGRVPQVRRPHEGPGHQEGSPGQALPAKLRDQPRAGIPECARAQDYRLGRNPAGRFGEGRHGDVLARGARRH